MYSTLRNLGQRKRGRADRDMRKKSCRTETSPKQRASSLEIASCTQFPHTSEKHGLARTKHLPWEGVKTYKWTPGMAGRDVSDVTDTAGLIDTESARSTTAGFVEIVSASTLGAVCASSNASGCEEALTRMGTRGCERLFKHLVVVVVRTLCLHDVSIQATQHLHSNSGATRLGTRLGHLRRPTPALMSPVPVYRASKTTSLPEL